MSLLVKKPNAKAHIPMHRRIVCAINIAKIRHQLPNPEGFSPQTDLFAFTVGLISVHTDDDFDVHLRHRPSFLQ